MKRVRTETVEDTTYYRMKTRCYNQNYMYFHRYGGRGIKVCERWLNSKSLFISDMGTRPSSKHSLDRVDNDGDYEPTNCRWATLSEQASNKGMLKSNTSGVGGVYFDKQSSKWEVRYRKTYFGRFNSFKNACEFRRIVRLLF